MLALARMLAACAPAPRVTRTLACHVLALPMRVADTQLFAVGAPELARALCRGGREGCQARVLERERGSRQNLSPVLLSAFWGPSPMLDPVSGSDPCPFKGPAPLPCPHPGPLLTRVAVGTKVAMAAAALARAHAHFVLRARGVALAHRCGQEGPELPRALPPHCSLLSVSQPAALVPGGPHSPTPHSSPCCLQPAQHAGSWELQAEKGLLSLSPKPLSQLGLPGNLPPHPQQEVVMKALPHQALMEV